MRRIILISTYVPTDCVKQPQISISKNHSKSINLNEEINQALDVRDMQDQIFPNLDTN